VPIAPDTNSLETRARAVLAEVRAALAGVLSSFDPPIHRPRDLCRVLGLHQTLAWKVLRVVEGPDIFADARFIPGPAGLQRFHDAAVEQGIAPDVVDTSRRAFDKFHALIGSHAGDRASLDLMLNGMVADDRIQADGRSLRKQGFRCASATWGVQMKTRVLSKILSPGAKPGTMDVALIRGFIGMRRIRPGAPLTLARVVILDNDGKARRQVVSEPLEPESASSGVFLLREFCSEPLPEIRIVPGPDGTPEQQLGEAPIGRAATVFSGEVMRSSVSRYRDEHNRFTNTALVARAPVEAAVIDLWTHRELFPNLMPRSLLYGELCGVPWYKQVPASAERLPFQETPRPMGGGLDAARLTGVPRYLQVMQHSFSLLGWNPDDFVLHRLRVDYPVIATAMVLQAPLPEAP
jgi:hypothetical protein